MAAKQGQVDAQFRLGVMYDEGQGVSQDQQEAVKWFHLAADLGYVSAQFRLAVML